MTGHRDPAFMAMELLAELENAGYDVSDDCETVGEFDTASDIVTRWFRDLMSEIPAEPKPSGTWRTVDPLTVAQTVQRELYRDNWAEVNLDVEEYSGVEPDRERCVSIDAVMQDGREFEIGVTEVGKTTRRCGAVHRVGENRCFRQESHTGRHVGDGAIWDDGQVDRCGALRSDGLVGCTRFKGHASLHRGGGSM